MREVINKLRYLGDGVFPAEAVEGCVAGQEEAAELLLEELDKLIACKELATENEDYMLHLYAAYLLGQFKDKRAFRRIIDLISFSPDEVAELFGDVLTEDLPGIIYSTYDGDLALLQRAIENPGLNEYARGTVMAVYGKLYVDGVVSKDACISYLRKLIYHEDYEINPYFATDIQGVVIERNIAEMSDDIKYLYDHDMIDADMYGEYDEFIELMDSGDAIYERVEPVLDTAESMRWWACFKRLDGEESPMDIKLKALMASLAEDDMPRKAGRNEPCPCGSGKKYKKCCLN